MRISFCKNLEYQDNRYTYDMLELKPKGTYYIKILNDSKYIIEYLEEIKDFLKNCSEELSFPRIKWDFLKEHRKLLETIKKDLYEIDNEVKKDLEDTKKGYETKINLNRTNENIDKIYKERIETLEERYKSKSLIIEEIEKNIRFIKMHIDKVDFFIIKDLFFKKQISKNYIDYFFSSELEFPAYKKEMYYEEEEKLKNIKGIYSRLKDKYGEEYRDKINDFFQETQFFYIDKYEFSKIYELLNVYYNEIIKDKINIKKCKNCGKYFIPHNKQIYCDNISPQNPNKTCRLLSDDIKEKEDKIYEQYRKAYKTQHNKLSRNIGVGNISEKDLRERFDKWNKTALLKKDSCKTVEEYKEWYDSSKNWIIDYK